MYDRLSNLLGDHLLRPANGVSIGCFGALAEFQDAAAAVHQAHGVYTAVSERGALRIAFRDAFGALAYEALSAADDAWQCGIAITVPRASAGSPARGVLTELGPDREAIRSADQGAVLFDIGVGVPNVDYCVRTGEGRLIDQLRAHCGEAVAAGPHPLLERLIEFSPQRVALSAAGRIEVYQRIDRHRTPQGPHTHLLPGLLARRRTHSANIPVPRGDMPVLMLHPENPLVDECGHRRSFASAAFTRFEAILAAHGLPDYFAEKQRLRAAVATAQTPASYVPPAGRPARLAMRIALRQLMHAPPDTGDTAPWLVHFRR